MIERECGMTLSIRAVGNYLARRGFTPQQPIKRTYEQSAPAVKVWIEDTFPAIAARAKAEEAEIHWGDESVGGHVREPGREDVPTQVTPIQYTASCGHAADRVHRLCQTNANGYSARGKLLLQTHQW